MDEDDLRAFYATKGVEWVEVYMQSNQMNGLQKPVAVQWLADQKKAQNEVDKSAQRALGRHALGAHVAAWIAAVASIASIGIAFWS